MAPPRKARIAVSSAHAVLYPDGKETRMTIIQCYVTGSHLTGTYQPDWLSQQEEWLHDEDRKVLEDHRSQLGPSKLDNLLKPSDIKPENPFFASAGHASLIDYPTAKGLQEIAAKIYAKGGIISAVCHGGAIFPGIIDPFTNKSIIPGKRVTGFTTRGDKEKRVLDTIKSWKRPTETSADDAGAIYVSPPGPWV
ncbi:class I glutamine amidotransferase-like protein [Lipomyces starkeyi]